MFNKSIVRFESMSCHHSLVRAEQSARNLDNGEFSRHSPNVSCDIFLSKQAHRKPRGEQTFGRRNYNGESARRLGRQQLRLSFTWSTAAAAMIAYWPASLNWTSLMTS
jgi:hypothetical protein